MTNPSAQSESGPANSNEEVTVSPRVRGRVLIFYLAASLIATVSLVAILWPSWLDQTPPPPLPDALGRLIWYTLLFAFLIRPLRRTGTSLRRLFASRPARAAMLWATMTAIALLALSLASSYAVYLPLSYVSPEFVEWWLIDDALVMIWTRGDLYALANCVNFLVLVLVAPFVEEVFFRGLLLPSWASRWGPKKAIIFSSLLFGVLHFDALGGFIFGVVTSVVFLRTGSLWLPFVIHSANNTLVWILVGSELLILGEHATTLADLQSLWWLGVLGLCVGAPLLLAAMRRLPQPPGPA